MEDMDWNKEWTTKESGMLATIYKGFIAMQDKTYSSSPKRQKRRQFSLTNYRIFIRRNDVKFSGIWFVETLCKPFFVLYTNRHTGALSLFMWFDGKRRLDERSDRDAWNVTKKGDRTIATVFVIHVIIIIIIVVIIIFRFIIMSVNSNNSFIRLIKNS